MLSLILCASLCQFDSEPLADNPANAFVVTREQNGAPALREQVAEQLGNAWRAKKQGSRVTFGDPEPRYSEDSPMARLANERDGSWPKLLIDW
ncbi:MAG: hypothetical protein ACRC5D_06285 [Aeromonas allosaccharophila]